MHLIKIYENLHNLQLIVQFQFEWEPGSGQYL